MRHKNNRENGDQGFKSQKMRHISKIVLKDSRIIIVINVAGVRGGV